MTSREQYEAHLSALAAFGVGKLEERLVARNGSMAPFRVARLTVDVPPAEAFGRSQALLAMALALSGTFRATFYALWDVSVVGLEVTIMRDLDAEELAALAPRPTCDEIAEQAGV